jgi:hypothetical protein
MDPHELVITWPTLTVDVASVLFNSAWGTNRVWRFQTRSILQTAVAPPGAIPTRPTGTLSKTRCGNGALDWL